MHNGKARAFTNIALIKYWGKKDPQLILPMNNSLSLTLDAFYTETSVSFSKEYTADSFYLDGQLQDEKSTEKVRRFLDLVREQSQIFEYAIVQSQNFVPTAAGLASSASGLAALAGACNDALGLNLSDKELSRLARKGSGSACRSIYGGFVEWEKGDSDQNSYAFPVPSNHWEDELAMIFILINDKAKDISSRNGMQRTVGTSTYYTDWVKNVDVDIKKAREAIIEHDFQALGEVTESNCLKMHATTLAASPPFTYWTPDSLRAMNKVHDMRQAGQDCYFTMDAGPNVKVLCQKKDSQKIYNELQKEFPVEQLVMAYAGKGMETLETEVAK
ncbi:diphosphomevalonate decarboxylase [Tetragenococcus halophilus]|uniref:diphosphomevalonate decarboxylase n=1 Tax=Tetragenococcus halophilus (strain DSM 20338 / JCM 20259 / NCIMB 9735 / NBRC 12172) TaxID=945021 RepID=A0AAN1VQ04_TETHN|nr:diphosphomevalonate decarboxylase [Tetragenococcus halophilus]AOF48105.1 diphosphomevalonate decarboxylase [Tetragenococcus halophilus]MCF1676085.1 diphosphomevalonate decarboxylase [Tetragenococcus halophilus]NWO00174.1 diphosphomevalonate decarboxylase [Tetragenococcus halophilus]QXN87035.1 diphosphomevalonate decarboxylase [Tetragenococcus halophilus]RQD30787.1 diphosphomevalonate decarboxylase [Tetragenococcus halophilus subsp. halophilus DSM 20339]